MVFNFNTRELSENRKDLQTLNFVGLTREYLVLDPLAVLNLDNQQYFLLQIMDRAREEAARAAKEAAAAAEAGTAGTVFNSSSEGVTSLPDSSPAVLES